MKTAVPLIVVHANIRSALSSAKSKVPPASAAPLASITDEWKSLRCKSTMVSPHKLDHLCEKVLTVYQTKNHSDDVEFLSIDETLFIILGQGKFPRYHVAQQFSPACIIRDEHENVPKTNSKNKNFLFVLSVRNEQENAIFRRFRHFVGLENVYFSVLQWLSMTQIPSLGYNIHCCSENKNTFWFSEPKNIVLRMSRIRGFNSAVVISS